MDTYFDELVGLLSAVVQAGESFSCLFYAEQSDFIRFNHSRIRQAGTVQQQSLRLELSAGAQHASATLVLAGELAQDRQRLYELVENLRQRYRALPADPYFLPQTEGVSGASHHENRLPDAVDMVSTVLAAGEGGDIVGIFASGPQFHGFANDLGQRNWHSSLSFNFDWSHYGPEAIAVKSRYAGFDWQNRQLEAKVSAAQDQLVIMRRARKTLPPGRYRAYLAPPAVAELIGLLCWGGFSIKAQRTGSSPLLPMTEQKRCLHTDIQLSQIIGERSLAPNFQSSGYPRPPELRLIENGCYRESLVAPRSAAEYGLPCNGAEPGESPAALTLAGGELALADVLAALDTGLYIGNLWYLNYSDRNTARITGMTRFATFWVENAKPVAPLTAMRFDDSIYRLFGEQFSALTQERELLLDPDTYFRRSTFSLHLPGLLVNELTLTL